MKDIDWCAIFQALSDTTRRNILTALQGVEKNATAIQNDLGIPQSTLSRHMNVLCKSGIVVSRKEKTSVMYSVSEDVTKKIRNKINELLVPYVEYEEYTNPMNPRPSIRRKIK